MKQKSGEPLAIALSGGGHRATLFTLGGLLALVDRGLNKDVKQIASVSGGSITNAAIAQQGDFDQLEPGQLDDTAAKLTKRIVTKGVLRTRLIVAVIVALAAISVCYAFLIGQWIPTPAAAFTGVVLFFASFLFTGRFIEWRIDRAFFTDQDNPRTIGTIAGAVEHVFCATDLVTGRPVYFSSALNGVIYRQIGGSDSFLAPPSAQRWSAPAIRISDAVRASAAFPGIPPRRMSFDPNREQSTRRAPAVIRDELRTELEAEEYERLARPPNLAFLGDGGIWNNLGSQVLREDRFYMGTSSSTSTPNQLLCIDASAGLAGSSTWKFLIPGLSLLTWIMRTLHSLSANSVQPRKSAMLRALRRRSLTMERRSTIDTLDTVADLAPISRTELRLEGLARHRQDIAESAPEVKRWKHDVAEALDRWFYKHSQDASPEDATKLAEEMSELARNRPSRKFKALGTLDEDEVENLTMYKYWHELCDVAKGDTDAPTTLGSISANMARRLIARGYLNTLLVSLLHRPIGHSEIDALSSFRERLDSICSATETATI